MRNEVLSHNSVSRYVETDKGNVVRDETYPFDFTSKSQSRSDVVHVARDSSQWRTPTPYSFTLVQRDVFPVSYSAEFRNPWNNRQGTYLGILGQTSFTADATVVDIPFGVKQRVLTQALLNLDSLKWDISESLLSLKESVNMIADSARVLQRAMLACARKDVRGMAKALKVNPPKELLKDTGRTSAGMWNSFHFGWAPVVDDIAKSAFFLSDEANIAKVRLHARSRANYVHAGSWVDTGTLYTGDGSVSLRTRYRNTVFCEYSVSLWYALDAPALRSLAEFGLTDPFSTAWALAPMSFVADWVLPIGDVLRAYSATRGLSFRGGSNTNFRRANLEFVPASLSHSNGFWRITQQDVAYPAPASVIWNRAVWDSSPLPIPSYWKDPFDAWKVTTSVALLRQFT